MVFLNKTISNSFFDIMMPIITNQNFLVVIGLILVGYLGYFGGKRGWITLVILLVAAGTSDAVCAQIIKPWVGRIRPSHEFYEYINLLVSRGGKWSFPSNHAANSFAFATILSYFYDKHRVLLFSVASMIAFSRICWSALSDGYYFWFCNRICIFMDSIIHMGNYKNARTKKRENVGLVC